MCSSDLPRVDKPLEEDRIVVAPNGNRRRTGIDLRLCGGSAHHRVTDGEDSQIDVDDIIRMASDDTSNDEKGYKEGEFHDESGCVNEGLVGS